MTTVTAHHRRGHTVREGKASHRCREKKWRCLYVTVAGVAPLEKLEKKKMKMKGGLFFTVFLSLGLRS